MNTKLTVADPRIRDVPTGRVHINGVHHAISDGDAVCGRGYAINNASPAGMYPVTCKACIRAVTRGRAVIDTTYAVGSDETHVTTFTNSDGDVQLVTDGPGAECPACGYPERHRIIRATVGIGHDAFVVVQDGCPSCEAPHANNRLRQGEGNQ